MLQSMRHLAQSWLFKGLMLILVISFGIWGIGDIFRGNPMQRKVAKTGSEVITVQALERGFDEQLVEARHVMGPDLTPQQAKKLGLLDMALDSLVNRAALAQQVKALGLDVNEKAALDWLTSQPAFRNKDGSFNQNLLHQVMEKTHMDEQRFFAEERKALGSRMLIQSFEAFGKSPQSVTDPLVAARGQKRILDVVTIANNGIRDIPAPDDKALREYYQNHSQNFTAPEYRALTIAKLSTDDVAKDIPISDDQLKKEYDARATQFTHPERRDILQVVVQDEAKAKQLSAAARAGGNLANAADAMGYKTVPLNGLEEKTVLAELSKPIFALKAGQVSDPVKSPLGWHVLQVKKITPEGTPGFDDVKNELRETMKHEQAIDGATRIVNQLDDELAAGHALEDIADSMKLRLVKIPAVDADGKTPDGKAPPELPAQADVLKSGFGQNASETSPIIDDKNGNYIVVRTDEVVPSAVRPFEKVVDQVTAAWKAQEQAKHAAMQAETIAKALRDGKAPSSFAAQGGVEVRVSKPISALGDKDPGLPAEVLPRVMNMKKGEVITAEVPGQQLVLRLAEIAPVGDEANDATRGRVGTEVNHDFSNELSDQYLKYLHVLYPVTIDHDAVDTLREQGQQGG